MVVTSQFKFRNFVLLPFVNFCTLVGIEQILEKPVKLQHILIRKRGDQEKYAETKMG